MFTDLVQWEINFKSEDLFNHDAVLREEATAHYGDAYSIPELDYSELDIFDSVTPGFSIDSDDVFNSRRSAANDSQSMIRALMELYPGDLLDINQVYTEIVDLDAYDVSKVFSYDGVDIDSYDTVSIKMPHIYTGSRNAEDWPAIFGEIESYVQKTITEDISDVVISDAYSQPLRPGMTLVKGNRRANLFSSFEKDFTESQNTFTEGLNSWAQGQAFNIPMQFYMENGELYFRINLTEINLRDLSRMRHLPREMDMKSVLSLISKKSKAK